MAEKTADETNDDSDGGFEFQSIPIPQALDTREKRLDPFPWFKEMREKEPVRYDEYREVWDVFRYDDVEHVLDNEPEKFSAQPQPLEQLRGTPWEPFADTMIQDPPKHDRLRGAAEAYFQPGALKQSEEVIRNAVEKVVNEALGGGNEFDFRKEIAQPLPAETVGTILGIPPEDRDQIARWSYARTAAQSTDSDESGMTNQEFGEAMKDMFEYLNELIEEKKENPQDDVLSDLVHKEVGSYGETLTKNELIMTTTNMILGGSGTTMNFLTNAIWTLEEEGILNDVIEGEIDRQPVFEEVLRYRSPARTFNKTTVQEVELGGKTIPEGERLEVWVGSANRDERKFDDADEFKPGRKPNPHLAFGSGLHFCIGSALVRLETEILFEELFDRISRMEADLNALEPEESYIMYGTSQLPVTVET